MEKQKIVNFMKLLNYNIRKYMMGVILLPINKNIAYICIYTNSHFIYKCLVKDLLENASTSLYDIFLNIKQLIWGKAEVLKVY